MYYIVDQSYYAYFVNHSRGAIVSYYYKRLHTFFLTSIRVIS